MILDKAKALVAAAVTFAASWVTLKWGFEIPADLQVAIASAISSLVAGFFTWLIPNKEPA